MKTLAKLPGNHSVIGDALLDMSKKLPVLKPKKVIKALERDGFQIRRITGGHYILKKGNHIVTVPYHNKDLKAGTLASVIKQASFTVEEFLDLL